MRWDKLCIQDISWNNIVIISDWLLMFGEYQNIMIFLPRMNQNDPLQKKEN
jgi:hypothetical protein